MPQIYDDLIEVRLYDDLDVKLFILVCWYNEKDKKWSETQNQSGRQLELQ